MTEEMLLEMIVQSCKRHKVSKIVLTDIEKHHKAITMLVHLNCIECTYKGNIAVITLLKDKIEKFTLEGYIDRPKDKKENNEKNKILERVKLGVPDKHLRKNYKKIKI